MEISLGNKKGKFDGMICNLPKERVDGDAADELGNGKGL